jgi:peptide/nickel transport system substrate-binding protein
MREYTNSLNYGLASVNVWNRCVFGVGMALLAAVAGAGAGDYLEVPGLSGRAGGRLVYSERTEPKTLNPLSPQLASDIVSRDIIHRLTADLVHINRATLRTEPALAERWTISPDGLRYTLDLRRGVSFSDGQPFDADDVIFTFQVYLDEKIGSPQRNLWILDGKPVRVRRLDAYRVEFDLPRVDAVGERIFDSVPILPRHLLEGAYRQGKLLEVWGLHTPPAEIAGLGPFRFKQYVPGQRVVLERNPYYWKQDEAGNRLPYLSELDFSLDGNEDMQVLRFEAGESDLVSRVSAHNYGALEKQARRRGYVLQDAGPGFEWSFLCFNLARPGVWQRAAFRRAVSAAIDRSAIVRLVYQGYASPLGAPVAAGNQPWVDSKLVAPARSVERARGMLAEDGFHWAANGALVGPDGKEAGFSIIASSGNPERTQMAALIQEDLKAAGIRVEVVPLESLSLLDRLTRTRDFEVCLAAIPSADADPSADLNVWLSSGGTHLWNPGQKTPGTPWEAEIDRLMRQQMVTRDYGARKRLFDRVQEIAIENMPVVPLVTPHLLVGAKAGLGNVRPVSLDPYALWNIEEIYWRKTAGTPPGQAQ